MTRKQRDKLLKEITDDVAALVLRDNYLQTQALTVTQTLSARLLDRHVHFMRTLEKAAAASTVRSNSCRTRRPSPSANPPASG